MRARSLFTKIFLWFWLAIILVAVAAIISGVWIRPDFELSENHAKRIAGMLQELPARLALDAWERAGQSALRDQLDRWKRQTTLEGFLLKKSTGELSGKPLPKGIERLIDKALSSRNVEAERLGNTMYAATPITGAQGDDYVYVSEIPPARGLPRPSDQARPPAHPDGPPGPPGPPGGRAEPHGPAMRPPVRPPDAFLIPPPIRFLLEQPERLAIVLVAVIVTGGAVCYWLARALTSPLGQLRTATTRLADGDLSVRVGQPLINRHDEIGELGRDFDRMAGRLDLLLTTERRLLRDISHELRSPLARLNIALGIARQHAAKPALGQLDRIESEADRLNELIGQLLTLARLESGIEKTLADAVDLVELVNQIVDDADFEAQGRGCRVRLPSQVPCATTGNRELLRRAIENVVRNAVNYTAAGTDVEVSLLEQSEGPDSKAVIRVRDHGPGLPDAELSEVFRPFYRVGDDRDRDTGGAGLGLAIADRAVRVHGGTITAANALDGGLIVEIKLPVGRVADMATAPPSSR